MQSNRHWLLIQFSIGDLHREGAGFRGDILQQKICAGPFGVEIELFTLV